MFINKLVISISLLFLFNIAYAGKLIPPTDIQYLGAFRVPQGGIGNSWWGYAKGNITFNPNGNSGAGSLIGIGADTQGKVTEITIPSPKIGSIDILNTATTLKGFVDISGGEASCGGLDSLCLGDVEFMPKQGSQTTDKLYWQRLVEYMPDNKPSFGWSETDINNPNPKGLWQLSDVPARTSGYSVVIPKSWADAYVSGRYLGVGQNKINGGGSWGPTLYAIAPWTTGNPPTSGATVPSTTLLLYDGFTSRQYTIKNYSHGDSYNDAVWVTAGNKQALIFSGTEAFRSADDLGSYSWAYPWERYRCGQLGCGSETETITYGCNPSGYDGIPYIGVLRFFDPDDLAAVAQGVKKSWQVAPYAVFPLERYMYTTQGTCRFYPIGGIAYDSTQQRMFVVERNVDGDYPVIHVFKLIDSGVTEIDTVPPSKPTNLQKSGATISWDPSTDNIGGSSNIVYVIFKNYSGQWRPIMETTKTSWVDPAPDASISTYDIKAYDAVMNESGQSSSTNLLSSPLYLRILQ